MRNIGIVKMKNSTKRVRYGNSKVIKKVVCIKRNSDITHIKIGGFQLRIISGKSEHIMPGAFYNTSLGVQERIMIILDKYSKKKERRYLIEIKDKETIENIGGDMIDLRIFIV